LHSTLTDRLADLSGGLRLKHARRRIERDLTAPLEGVFYHAFALRIDRWVNIPAAWLHTLAARERRHKQRLRVRESAGITTFADL
jgi:hypothetical protein